jgi:hypothetical protein
VNKYDFLSGILPATLQVIAHQLTYLFGEEEENHQQRTEDISPGIRDYDKDEKDGGIEDEDLEEEEQEER